MPSVNRERPPARELVFERYASLHDLERLGDKTGDYERMWRAYDSIYLSYHPADHGTRILDLGCGGGHLLFYLHRTGYRNLTGVDASPEQVERCRALEVGEIVHARAHEYLEREEEPFEMIFCRHLIEHFSLDDALDLLIALRQRLNPGGKLLLATPNALSPWAGYHLHHELTHERLYTPDSLQLIMNLAEFEDVEVSAEGPVAFDLRSRLRASLYRLRHWWLTFTFAVEIGLGRERTIPLIFTPALMGVGRAPRRED